MNMSSPFFCFNVLFRLYWFNHKVLRRDICYCSFFNEKCQDGHWKREKMHKVEKIIVVNERSRNINSFLSFWLLTRFICFCLPILTAIPIYQVLRHNPFPNNMFKLINLKKSLFNKYLVCIKCFAKTPYSIILTIKNNLFCCFLFDLLSTCELPILAHLVRNPRNLKRIPGWVRIHQCILWDH